MATLAKLVVKLITDVNEFTKGMDLAVNKYTKMGQQMASIGDRMTLGVTLPLVAAGTASIKLASDLMETRNKASVVFGSMSDDMLKWGKTAIDTMGLSENHALSYASSLGAILNGSDVAIDKTVEMSKTLTSLVADLSSFNNISRAESFEKIKAALVGSYEPLRSVGITMNEAAVKAWALENSLGGVGRELTAQELSLARYSLLMEQAAKTGAVGDFKATAGSLANLSSTFKELTEETMANFGLTLLPIATDFMKALIPILEGFNKLPQPVKSVIVSLTIFTAALGPLMSGGGRLLQLGKGLQGLFGKAGLTSLLAKLGITAAGAGGTLAGVGSAILAVLGPALLLGVAIAALVLAIKYFGPQAFETFKMLSIIAGATFQRLEYEFKQLPIRFGQWIGNSVKAIRSRISDFVNSGKYLMGGFISGITSMAITLVQAGLKPVMAFVNAVRNALLMHSNSKLAEQWGHFVTGGFVDGLDDGTPAVSKAATKMAQGTSSGVSSGLRSNSGRGGGNSLQFNFTFNGDVSDERQKELEKKMKTFFNNEIVTLFGEATS